MQNLGSHTYMMRQGGDAMVFADRALARRVESAEAENARASALYPGAAVMEVGGGCAIFVGADSPLTHAVGLGLAGPVGEAEIGSMEEFFAQRGASASVDLCPLADPGLIEELAGRGYRVSEFNNVLVRPLANLEITPAPRVRRAATGEDDLWSQAVGEGFFEQLHLTGSEMDVGRAVFAMPGAFCYLTTSGSGEIAGGAAMTVHDGVGLFFADATIGRFRRAGLHSELIAARLNEAAAQSCDLAGASTLPGSGSQRNYERLGFQVVYTRLTLVNEF